MVQAAPQAVQLAQAPCQSGLSRNGLNFRDAMMELGKWKKFMASLLKRNDSETSQDEPTKKLDDLYPQMTNFQGRCSLAATVRSVNP